MKTFEDPKPVSFRMKQIDELIFRSLSNIIREEVELPSGVFFTIIKVITSKDLALAKIFYITQPEEQHIQIINAIKKRRTIIIDRLKDDIVIRKMPKILFIFDQNEINALKMEEKIRLLNKNLK